MDLQADCESGRHTASDPGEHQYLWYVSASQQTFHTQTKYFFCGVVFFLNAFNVRVESKVYEKLFHNRSHLTCRSVFTCNIFRKENVFCFPADGCLFGSAGAESGAFTL